MQLLDMVFSFSLGMHGGAGVESLPYNQAFDLVTSSYRERVEVEEQLPEDFKSKLSRLVTNLEVQGKLNDVGCSNLVQSLIMEHCFSSECIMSLPSSIVTTRYGNLTPSDLIDVCYIQHEIEQKDGWSCGERTVFSAAGVQKYFDSMTKAEAFPERFPENIDICLRTFFGDREVVKNKKQLVSDKRHPAIIEAIDYLKYRYKVRLAADLLRSNIEATKPAIEFLKENEPKIAEAIHVLQSDYFIVRGAQKFLENNDVENAKLMLTRVSRKNNPVLKKALVDLYNIDLYNIEKNKINSVRKRG